ncbi:MAG TPA: NAD(P)-binding protein [Thermoanaerobaculia bacterium]|nr:NAD(P)-binding protein [Thermoanaerobaculia bacterium]
MSAPPRHLGDFDLAVVGSGCAGSVLARAVKNAGRRVLLVERGRHPRFAIGESSTPLAALALERLAERWEMPDLRDLAAYGRWRARLPHLRRGLKRGFTFYRHERGLPFRNDIGNEHRLLVAASPDDEVADAHWLRADVDHHLVTAAEAAGVCYRDRLALDGCEIGDDGVRLAGAGEDGRVTARAAFVVDASGPGGFLAQALGIAAGEPPVPLDTGLLFAHVTMPRTFVEAAVAGGARMDAGPYPDDRAAVHHLLAEGWTYVLPFDHGVASIGFLIEGPPAAADLDPARDPTAAWRQLLAHYPTLQAQLGDADFVIGPRWVPRVPHRLARAAGERWALLPHAFAFTDPLFSTGLAQSFLAIERLAAHLVDGDGTFEEYGGLLAREADQVQRLVALAYAARGDMRAFIAVTFLYFTTVSFEEVRQRLLPPPAGRSWCWQGFLGAGDPALEATFADAAAHLADGPEPFAAWIEQQIEPRNVVGLADPARRNLYPVDLDALVAAAPRLGLTREEMEAALPRLRGR